MFNVHWKNRSLQMLIMMPFYLWYNAFIDVTNQNCNTQNVIKIKNQLLVI